MLDLNCVHILNCLQTEGLCAERWKWCSKDVCSGFSKEVFFFYVSVRSYQARLCCAFLQTKLLEKLINQQVKEPHDSDVEFEMHLPLEHHHPAVSFLRDVNSSPSRPPWAHCCGCLLINCCLKVHFPINTTPPTSNVVNKQSDVKPRSLGLSGPAPQRLSLMSLACLDSCTGSNGRTSTWRWAHLLSQARPCSFFFNHWFFSLRLFWPWPFDFRAWCKQTWMLTQTL